MSDRALGLLLAERRRDEADAVTALERAERTLAALTEAASRDRDGASSARAALDDVTCALTAAGRASAWELQRLSARRVALRAALTIAESRARESDVKVRVAAGARSASKRALAEAIERRRAVEDRVETLAVEARRARAAREDDDAAEAHAARASGTQERL